MLKLARDSLRCAADKQKQILLSFRMESYSWNLISKDKFVWDLIFHRIFTPIISNSNEHLWKSPLDWLREFDTNKSNFESKLRLSRKSKHIREFSKTKVMNNFRIFLQKCDSLSRLTYTWLVPTWDQEQFQIPRNQCYKRSVTWIWIIPSKGIRFSINK